MARHLLVERIGDGKVQNVDAPARCHESARSSEALRDRCRGDAHVFGLVIKPGAQMNVQHALIVRVVGIVLLGITTGPVQAQRITGRVIEDVSGERIPAAQLLLVDEEGTAVRLVSSDTAGFFLLEARRPGTYRLRVQHISYAEYTTDGIDLHPDVTVTIVVRLAAEGIPLQPIEVRARGGDERGRHGFERRRSLGKGVFLTDDSIRARSPAVVSDAFYGVPGVQVFEGMGSVTVSSMYGGKCFVMFRDHMPVGKLVGTMPDLRRAISATGSYGEGAINTSLKVQWIKGIEIYRDISEVPRELRTASRLMDLYPTPGSLMGRSSGGRIRNEACGMIWIWTDIGW